MKRINVHLTEKQIAGLRNLASATGLKMSETIRRAIDDYLKKHRGDNVDLHKS